MSAPMKRVVAWIDWNEWSSVYEELFSDDPLRQRHALDRITVWRCRVPYRLATAIECTSQLVCAQLQEVRARSEGALRSRDQELCMSYAMVLVRFVNLLTEKRQTKAHPLAVHTIAEELGVPEWLVELRHDISHSTFPSLSVMREATHQALQWLKQEYWEVQQRDLEQDTTPSAIGKFTEDSITELLAEFIQQQVEVVSTKNPRSSKATGELEKKLQETVQKLKQLLHIPSLRDAVIDQAVQVMTAGGQLLESLQINQHVLMESDELTLPVRLENIWQPLLQLFHQSHTIPLLLQKLLQQQSEAGGLQDRLFAGWVTTVVTAIQEGSQNGPELHSVYEGGCGLNPIQLLRLCLKNPNRYTTRLLNRLFTVTGNDVSQTQRHQLVKLVSLYTQANSSDNDITLDDTDRVLGAMHRHSQSSCPGDVTLQCDKKEKQTNQQVDTRWQHMTEPCNWSLYAFGDGPGCTAYYTNLELDQCVDNIHRSLPTDRQDDQEAVDRCKSDSPVSIDNHYDMEVDSNDDCDIKASQTGCWTAKELYELKETIILF